MTDPRTDEPLASGPGPGGMVPRDVIPATVLPPVKCRAHTSNGKPCKRWAIVGGFVCATHGGSAPQVRRVANERLLAYAPRAVQNLVGLAESAESEVVRLRANVEIIDRGIGKAVDVTLDLTPQDVSGGLSPLDLRISAVLDSRGVAPAPEILDADLVEPSDTGPDLPVSESPHT